MSSTSPETDPGPERGVGATAEPDATARYDRVPFDPAPYDPAPYDPAPFDPAQVDDEQFDGLVAAALDRVPPQLAELMDNCVVLVEDRPPADQPADLLGLYEGIPLTERGEFYSAVLPDRILIFREPILAMCRSLDEVVEEVHITVVHEIAHHFGIDDDRLHELGYA